MKKGIVNDLADLVKEEIITVDTAEKIKVYYAEKNKDGGDKLLITFAILGAILTGLGVILIIAHNWDDLSRQVKTAFSFLPLILAQVVCLYVLFKKYPYPGWRESSSSFLFLSIGAAISLISQTYNIPGSFSSFMLTWCLLGLPVIYIMQSSVVSLMYIAGITAYAVERGYFTYPQVGDFNYWLLLLAVLPFYYILFKIKPNSNFILFHHWIIPASLTIVLGSIATHQEEYLFLPYISMFGFFYLAGKSVLMNNWSRISNSYLLIGSAGMVFILLILSFDYYWKRHVTGTFSDFLYNNVFIVSVITTLAATGMLLYNHLKKIRFEFPDFTFLIFAAVFILGFNSSSVPVVIINLLILLIGISTINKGIKLNHLGILNYGLIIITALIICRFFDTEITYVIRGILFLLVGSGFFILNYRMIKNRQSHDQ